ncbi:hypothetical protein, partial [Nonomuraea sp. NPDC049784]|uniref:hypothetical protein n=1 Tax=Nonomuraea sp. NPDC049784 TaxID=3154361 RepID=UPI0034041DDE
HPITLRWLEARRLIRRQGPGPYSVRVITTPGRAAHLWGHYTPLHDIGSTSRIRTLAELETTYVVLASMLHHDQAQGLPTERELEHVQRRVAMLLGNAVGLPAAALPDRYAAPIALDLQAASVCEPLAVGPAGGVR